MPTFEQTRRYLHIERPPLKKVDAILVLGSPRVLPAEIAADLFRRGVADRIILTGGEPSPSGLAEAEAHRLVLEKEDVPMDCILMEAGSTNTLENTQMARALLQDPAISLVAVCRWFHSRRVLMTLRKHWPEAATFTFTYDSPFQE